MEPRDDERLYQLEEENRRLRERIDDLEQERQRARQRRRRLARWVLKTYSGKSLYGSVSRLVDEAFDLRLQRDTVKDFIHAVTRRLTKVGLVTLLFALAPLSLALLQTYYLKKQNEKLDYQNRRIEQQTYLQEAERRSSLVFLFDNMLDKMDEELRANPERRELSPQLVGRIVALSKALKPYRFLDGDTITGRPTSPERGQLLISLLTARLSNNTYDRIFSQADFSYTALDDANLESAYLRGINLSHARLVGVSLAGANCSFTNFEGAELWRTRGFLKGRRTLKTRFDSANFYDADLRECDFSGCFFELTNFSKARLSRVYFHEASFTNSKLELTAADSLDLSNTTLLGTTFGVANTRPGLFVGLDNAMADTASLAQLNRLPLGRTLVIDRSKPRFLITRDTFYLDDRVPFVVLDSFAVFRVER
jgi:uncharacterized protein YjbI with pentapeptide repeats